ncbi:WD40-repeat-containing domain protein [Suillus paluster]|uniref:WD40-repeat-containing domain protein n=1 Tax=Suillus paluster TaxID=48578 RepID=UPI001B86558A|nr:WD40-repeat-containing domain protein [Suillus paluster]KAG1752616.1 WD40-repeat-containing domain protein [Suillus paluster]
MTSRIHEDEASFQAPIPPTRQEKPRARMTLEGHEEWVYSVAVIPGTRLLVTASHDKSLRLWDSEKGQQVGKPLLGHDDGVWTVAASPDGRWIVSGGWDGSIFVWEVETKKCVPVSFKGHEENVSGIVFSPDSETFASASDDKTIRVWLRKTGKTVLGPFHVGTTAWSVSYSPDGSRLAAGTGEHIIVWKVSNGEELLKIEQQAVGIAFTPDGLRLVSGNIHDIRISDAATGDIIKQFEAHTDLIQSLAIAPDGTKVASTSADSTTRFFDLTTFEAIGEPLEHPDVVYCVAFSDDSQFIVTGCHDNLARVWTVPQSDSEESKQPPHKDDRRRAGPSILIETVPRSKSRAGLPRGFFDDVERTYPPRRSAYGGSQDTARHSRIKDLVNRLPFRRQSQQARPEEERLHHSNGVKQFLQQHLSFRRSKPSQEGPPVVEVAAGRKFTVTWFFSPLISHLIDALQRLAAANLPEYKKVDDTRHPPKEHPGATQSTTANDPSHESSDIDSLPDVHWCKAFLCYYSCWSHGRLRMPPRWRLERVDLHRQDPKTSSS